MNELGTSLLVGGMALLCSGLIFLLPVPSKKPVNRATIEEDQARAEYFSNCRPGRSARLVRGVAKQCRIPLKLARDPENDATQRPKPSDA